MAKACIRLEGVILLLCGIGCIAGSFYAAKFVDNAFTSACSAVKTGQQCLDDEMQTQCDTQCASQPTEVDRDTCYTTCVDKLAKEAPEYTAEKCAIDIKIQANCTCGDTLASCDCSDSLIMGTLAPYWGQGCFAIGVVGFFGCFFCSGLPALISTRKWLPIYNLTCYSVCAGILFIPYIAVGGTLIGLAVIVSGKSDYFGDVVNDCEGTVEKWMEDGAGTVGSSEQTGSEALACGVKAFCAGFDGLSKDIVMTAGGVGVPFFIAGVTMFALMFSCCCCKKGMPGYDKDANYLEEKKKSKVHAESEEHAEKKEHAEKDKKEHKHHKNSSGDR